MIKGGREYWVVREGLSHKIAFEQISPESDRENHADVLERKSQA